MKLNTISRLFTYVLFCIILFPLILVGCTNTNNNTSATQPADSITSPTSVVTTSSTPPTSLPTTSPQYTQDITTTSETTTLSQVPTTTTTTMTTSTHATTTQNNIDIPTSVLPNGTLGSGYSSTVQVSGGTPPYTWSISTGVPPGLSLNAVYGVISGIPTVAGAYSFTISVTDSNRKTSSKSIFLTIISPDYGNLPLGEKGKLCYVNGSFLTVENIVSLYIDITLNDLPSNNDGLFFQLYQSTINNIGFSFGLVQGNQLVDNKTIEKYIAFSRWDSSDLSNVQTVEPGWSEKGNDGGAFVGIRYPYDWTPGSYRFTLAYMTSDITGDWYGLWVTNKTSGKQQYSGSIRFLSEISEESGISPDSSSWIELTYKDIEKTPIPNWHVSIDGMYATESGINYRKMSSDYGVIDHTDVYYNDVKKNILIDIGPEVIRRHTAGQLFEGAYFAQAVGMSYLTINTKTMTPYKINQDFRAVFTVTGGSSPYTWRLGIGAPSDLTINATTGVLTGYPTTSGTFTFFIYVFDNAGHVSCKLIKLVIP
jgi:hypothetical protein